MGDPERELIAGARRAMAEERRRLGEPPTPEELIAYAEGTPGAGERERIEAFAAADPDVARTLLDLAKAKSKPGHVLDGTSITPLLLGNGGRAQGQARKPLYWHFPGYLGAGKGSWRTTPAGAIRAGNPDLLFEI